MIGTARNISSPATRRMRSPRSSAPHLEARDTKIAKLADRLRALGEDADAILKEEIQ